MRFLMFLGLLIAVAYYTRRDSEGFSQFVKKRYLTEEQLNRDLRDPERNLITRIRVQGFQRRSRIAVRGRRWG